MYVWPVSFTIRSLHCSDLLYLPSHVNHKVLFFMLQVRRHIKVTLPNACATIRMGQDRKLVKKIPRKIEKHIYASYVTAPT